MKVKTKLRKVKSKLRNAGKVAVLAISKLREVKSKLRNAAKAAVFAHFRLFSDAAVHWISDPCAESPLVSLSTRPADETWSPSSSVISFTPCAERPLLQRRPADACTQRPRHGTMSC
jgi:hypothetical protein